MYEVGDIVRIVATTDEQPYYERLVGRVGTVATIGTHYNRQFLELDWASVNELGDNFLAQPFPENVEPATLEELDAQRMLDELGR
jgi:hypothetical protein